MKFIVDSYAWIEYLDGTSAGLKVRDVLTEKNEILTLNLVLAEVVSRTKRLEKDVNKSYDAITLNSKVIAINQEIAKEAGLLHAEMRKKINNFGLIDSILLVLARKLKASILTGDKHFKGMKEARLIK